MPPIRHILVLAVDGVQSLDVLGPVEIFHHAESLVPGSYRIDVVAPGTDGFVTMSNELRLGVQPLPDPPAYDAKQHHAQPRTRSRKSICR